MKLSLDPVSTAYNECYSSVSKDLAIRGCSKEVIEDIYNEVFLNITLISRKEGQEVFYSKTYVIKACRRLWARQRLKSRLHVQIGRIADNHVWENYEISDMLKLLLKHYNNLPALCREVLGLYSTGYTEKEISKALSLKSEKEANNKKYYCKKTLGAMMKNDPLFPEING